MSPRPTQTVSVRRRQRGAERPGAIGINVTNVTGTTTPTGTVATSPGSRPVQHAARATPAAPRANTNDLRGKVLRIKVKDGDIDRRPNRATQRGQRLHGPGGQPVPAEGDAPQRVPEIYAMGFRNPYRVQVDEQRRRLRDATTRRTPTSRENFRGPAGTGRVEVVRKPSNYGWPLCCSLEAPRTTSGTFNSSRPLDPANPKHYECDNPNRGPSNTSRWNTGRTITPPIAPPDLWYSLPRTTAARSARRASRTTTARAASARSCSRSSSRAASLRTARLRTSTRRATRASSKFPPYYNGHFFLGEFGQRRAARHRRSTARARSSRSTTRCPAARRSSPRRLPFECDNPRTCSSGPTATCTC